LTGMTGIVWSLVMAQEQWCWNTKKAKEEYYHQAH